MIKVLFFAQIREQLGCNELQMPCNENYNVEMLLNNLQARDANWQHVLSKANLLVAVNQTMSSKSALLKSGDEVAFFPPVTGG